MNVCIVILLFWNSGMLFAAVDAPPACSFEPRSLQQLALRSFVANTNWDVINSLYLKHEFSDRLYSAMFCERKYLDSPHEFYDWSVPNNVPIETYLKVMDYKKEDGVPSFAFERNLLGRCYVQVHFTAPGVLNLPVTDNICVPCYNTYVRFNSCNFHGFKKFVLIHDQEIIEGEDLIDYIQRRSNWCSCCNTTSLFSIKDGSQLGPYWFNSIFLMCNEIPLLSVADDN